MDSAAHRDNGLGLQISHMGKRPRIPQTVTVRAMGLLPVMYQTRVLAEELGITQQLLVQWIRLGAPHIRDRRGRAWINGKDFADWVDRQRRELHLGAQTGGTAFCPRCRAAIEIEDPSSATVGTITLVTGSCPRCGGPVTRKKQNGI